MNKKFTAPCISRNIKYSVFARDHFLKSEQNYQIFLKKIPLVSLWDTWREGEIFPLLPTIPFRVRKISHLHVFPLGRQNSPSLCQLLKHSRNHTVVITVQTWLPLPIYPHRLGLSASESLTRLTVWWFNDVYLRIKILWDYGSEKNTDATVVKAVQQKWKMHGSAALLVLCEIFILLFSAYHHSVFPPWVPSLLKPEESPGGSHQEEFPALGKEEHQT